MRCAVEQNAYLCRMFFSVSIVPDMPVPRRKRRHGDMPAELYGGTAVLATPPYADRKE